MAIVHHVEATVQVNPNRSEICEEGVNRLQPLSLIQNAQLEQYLSATSRIRSGHCPLFSHPLFLLWE